MTVVAIGAHIGDMDLTAGPALAEMALRGQRAFIPITPIRPGLPNGRFHAGLPMNLDLPRHAVHRLLYAENWEDADDFKPTLYLEISDEAFSRWHNAISGESFARSETYGFRYIDYYTALMTMRGCLARTNRACAFRTATPERTVLQEL